jgi:hypothetical protein
MTGRLRQIMVSSQIMIHSGVLRSCHLMLACVCSLRTGADAPSAPARWSGCRLVLRSRTESGCAARRSIAANRFPLRRKCSNAAGPASADGLSQAIGPRRVVSVTGDAFVIRRGHVLAAQCGGDGADPDFAVARQERGKVLGVGVLVRLGVLVRSCRRVWRFWSSVAPLVSALVVRSSGWTLPFHAASPR